MRTTLVALFLLASPVAAQDQPRDSLGELDTGVERARANQPGSLARVMDAFLRAYAAETPAWRTDVTAKDASEASNPPDGFQKGVTEQGLWYHFRPKTSDQLRLDERRVVMRDKRFGPFLAQMRGVADAKSITLPPAVTAAAQKAPVPPPPAPAISRADLLSRLLAGRLPPPDAIYFDISAEELMVPGRVLVTVDTTASTP
jgi:hypothetical protein